jgi:hypothetical protein
MGKMQELEGKLKELEKMRLMNTSSMAPGMILSKAKINPQMAVGCVYNEQGRGK